MAYWLIKSEPETWSWDDQVRKGNEGEPWSGVRNYQANNNMKAMKKGDLAFFYHSVNEKRIVGVVEIIKEHEPDPTDETGRFGLVRVKAVRPVPNPVTLQQVKEHPDLQNLPLVKQSRLSVAPVPEKEWSILWRMCGLDLIIS